jgi:cyclophilin family peptidyl-prolyl cis-trans isomerase
MLAREGKYNNCLFHRLVPGFMIQTGDPTGSGSGGQSYWGTPFRDEFDQKGAAKHDSRGVLAMANKGSNTNGQAFLSLIISIGLMGNYSSQFYITFKPAPHLDRKHTVFGKLVGGEGVLDALENLPRKEGTERPSKQVKITEIVMSVILFRRAMLYAQFFVVIRIHLRIIKPGSQRNLLAEPKKTTKLKPNLINHHRTRTISIGSAAK